MPFKYSSRTIGAKPIAKTIRIPYQTWIAVAEFGAEGKRKRNFTQGIVKLAKLIPVKNCEFTAQLKKEFESEISEYLSVEDAKKCSEKIMPLFSLEAYKN